MKIRLHQIFLLFFVLSTQLIFSQRLITGTVNDGDGQPMVGVSIIEEGTSNGTTVDFDGNFSITTKSDTPTLVFTYVGFETLTIEVGEESTLDVVMKDDLLSLGEVVVTAMGFEANKDDLGYASSTINGDLLTNSGETSLLNSLSGKASGLRISRTSGDPGAGSHIQIRGVSTLTRSTQPLIVIDGVPISNDTRNDDDSGGVNQQSRLNDINPNDIESISVLKGASAAALWGTKALGGVIQITTKNGDFNSKMKVTYKSTFSYDEINVKYPLQSQYGQGSDGVYSQTDARSWGDRIADRPGGVDNFNTNGEFFIDQAGNVYYPIVNKNSREILQDSNFDQIFDNGYFFENNLSISGGSAKSSMFFSLADLNQQGIIRNNSDYKRSTVRFNAHHYFNDAISLKLSSSYTRTKSNRILKGATSSGLYLGLLRTPADFDITGYRGDYYAASDASPITNRQRSYRNPLGADENPGFNNPLWTINEQENLSKLDHFITNVELTAAPNSWLTLIGRAGLDHYSEKTNQFFTPGAATQEFRNGLQSQELATNTIFNMDYIAKTAFNFTDDMTGDFLLGFNYNDRTRVVNGYEGTNFIQFIDVDSDIRDKNNIARENIVTKSTQGHERTVGVYSSLSFSLYDMFDINGTVRAETASTFGENSDKPFIFPSTSIAWQFSQLEPFRDSNFLSFGKLRASYGEVGVQPERYNTTNSYTSPTYGDAYGGSLNLGLFGNGGFVPRSARGNASLKPERKRELEFGADLRFFRNRLSLSGTYYTNEIEDVLLDLPLANTSGYTSIYTNGAKIENKGYELDLLYHIINSQNVTWSIDLTYSQVRNKVVDLLGIESMSLGGLAAVSPSAVVGQPVGVLWGSRILRDENGAIVFDEYGFPEKDIKEGVIGNPNPDWQGSALSTFKYKNLRLSVLLETFQGGDVFAGTKSALRDYGTWYDTANEVTATRNYFRSDGSIVNIGETFRGNVYDFGAGPVALTESWYKGEGGYFSGGNHELYVEDASWTRIREISIAYLLNGDWLKRSVGLESAEFSVTGRNLFLWTDFEGNDPDSNLSGVSTARGIDYFNNPSTKSYLFNLTLIF
ncbi:SusC/RagA family TonB-linked outer membrane protein [Abyssalbus ytuae]|uniref:SusC/RagA family TonB-linked outer membrane protein n=1 Tax=Abyssalbus ytuae TaxID=2926907 RepID=A0A9E7CTR7_9FLAO|nr:SusC/RagA family TonB-linked outer membrane protein [Abyssalbus ytuae]UOB18536.1 SusC/RagA family TonB-linked outer membrane protein [Abyssalbus ytuae]